MLDFRRLTAFFAAGALIAVGGHAVSAGEHPMEHPSEHPAPAKAAPASAVKDAKASPAVTKEDMADAITGYVSADANLKGGYFLVFDKAANRPLALTLEKVHKDRLSKVGEGLYFACADFRTHDGKMVFDLDVFMSGPNKAGLKVTEISVHKQDGVERYGWVEKGGVWSKTPMKQKKEWKGSDHEDGAAGEHPKEHPSEHPKSK